MSEIKLDAEELEEAGADYTVETTEELKTLLMKLVTEAEN